VASRSLLLASWTSGDWGLCGSPRRLVVVKDHPARPARRVEQQICDQGRPAGLMHGAETGAVVAVEVLIEQQVVFLRRVGLHELDTAVDGPPTIRAWEPYADQPISKIAGDIA
jgi:hypothetical protein